MTTLKFLLAAIIGVAMTTTVQGCFQTVYTDSSSYNTNSSGHAVIFNAPFTCDGRVTELTYYVSVAASPGDEEYFSVWKPIDGGNYELMDKQQITENTVAEHTQTLSVPERIEVHSGWVIGLHMSSNVATSPVPHTASSISLAGTGYAVTDLVDFAEQNIQDSDLNIGYIWNSPFSGSGQTRIPSIEPTVQANP